MINDADELNSKTVKISHIDFVKNEKLFSTIENKYDGQKILNLTSNNMITKHIMPLYYDANTLDKRDVKSLFVINTNYTNNKLMFFSQISGFDTATYSTVNSVLNFFIPDILKKSDKEQL